MNPTNAAAVPWQSHVRHCASDARPPGRIPAADGLQKESQSDQWVIPAGNLQRHPPQQPEADQYRNASKLKVAWTMSTGTLRGQEGQPLVIGNMMYFESSYPNFVYAIDLDNVGHIVWKFAPEQDKFSPSVACCDLVNSGVAYADGKIFSTALDTMSTRSTPRPARCCGASKTATRSSARP